MTIGGGGWKKKKKPSFPSVLASPAGMFDCWRMPIYRILRPIFFALPPEVAHAAAAGNESRDTGAAPSYTGMAAPLPAGITLYALPPDIFVMDSTPPPTTGSRDRDTMLCSMVMHCAAASTVSFVL